MAGSTVISQPPWFDYYSIKAERSQKEPPHLSPSSFYSPHNDFSTDSAPSPGSPASPVLTSPYQLPTDNDWINWEDDTKQQQAGPQFFKTEPYDPDLNSIPPRTLTASPAVNPMELSNPVSVATDDVPFGREGLNDNRPLFEPTSTPQSGPTTSAYPPLPVKTSPSDSGSPHISDPPSSPRYPTRKRKSSSSGSLDEDSHSHSHSPHSSPSPPPALRRANSHNHNGIHHNGNGIHDGVHNGDVVVGGGGTSAPKKTAHNMIEKRYRTNLNDKIAALRDSVPALRVMVHRLESAQHMPSTIGPQGGQYGMSSEEEHMVPYPGQPQSQQSQQQQQGMQQGDWKQGQDEDDAQVTMMMMSSGAVGPGTSEEDLGGLAPAHKLNKATILSKATEYIAHLERKNRGLAKENTALRSRVEGFEMLVMSRGGTGGVWS